MQVEITSAGTSVELCPPVIRAPDVDAYEPLGLSRLRHRRIRPPIPSPAHLTNL